MCCLPLLRQLDSSFESPSRAYCSLFAVEGPDGVAEIRSNALTQKKRIRNASQAQQTPGTPPPARARCRFSTSASTPRRSRYTTAAMASASSEERAGGHGAERLQGRGERGVLAGERDPEGLSEQR